MNYPCARTWVEFVIDEDERHVVSPIRCGSWKCEYCVKANAAALRRKIRAALAAWVELSGYEHAKFRYWAKFLTLTLPGSAWRALHSPVESEKILKASWRKLRNRLRRIYGDFDYIQVDELQPSGYPHLHVILLGKAFGPKSVLQVIRSYWCDKLEMGNVDIEVMSDLDGAAAYVTKYISKSKAGVLKKGNRVFSFSKGLNDLIKSQAASNSARVTPLRVGFLNGDGSLGKVFWERGDGLPLPFVNSQAVLNDLLDFFDSKVRRGKQLNLFDGGRAGPG